MMDTQESGAPKGRNVHVRLDHLFYPVSPKAAKQNCFGCYVQVFSKNQGACFRSYRAPLKVFGVYIRQV